MTDERRRAITLRLGGVVLPDEGIDDAPGKLVPVLQNFLNVAIFPNGGACHGPIEDCAWCVE